MVMSRIVQPPHKVNVWVWIFRNFNSVAIRDVGFFQAVMEVFWYFNLAMH